MWFEALFEDSVDAAFEHEGVVDGDHVNAGHPIPAGFAAPGCGGVHYVVADEEEGLEELGEPAEGGEVGVLLRGEWRGVEEDRSCVGDGQASVELATCVVFEGLWRVSFELWRGRRVGRKTQVEVGRTASYHSRAASGTW